MAASQLGITSAMAGDYEVFLWMRIARWDESRGRPGSCGLVEPRAGNRIVIAIVAMAAIEGYANYVFFFLPSQRRQNGERCDQRQK